MKYWYVVRDKDIENDLKHLDCYFQSKYLIYVFQATERDITFLLLKYPEIKLTRFSGEYGAYLFYRRKVREKKYIRTRGRAW